MYKIIIKYHYYIGTLNCPQDGPYTDDNGEPYEFTTLKAARAFLLSLGITLKLEPKVYCVDGTYMLSHGQYARPTFTIVKQGE